VQTNRRQSGFSLIEVLVVMVIFSIIIVAASQTFTGLLADFKKQSKIAETNIEGMLGLEVMRRDIISAGYGLYWSLDPKTAPTTSAFTDEVSVAADANGAALNDDLNSDAPRALVFGSGYGLNSSDRFAVRSMNVAANCNSECFNYLFTSPTFTVNSWTPANDNIAKTDYVTVMKPDDTHRWLVFTKSPAKFTAKMQDVLTSYSSGTTSGQATSIIFSLGTDSTPRLPFNRADFYIANTGMPSRCAAGTGVLYKKVVNLSTTSTGYHPAIPLLDCVADMQVAYRYDSTGGNYGDLVTDVTPTNGIDVFPWHDTTDDEDPVWSEKARQIREVRIYILAQEGQRDNTFTYPNQTVRVGEAAFSFGTTATQSIPLGRTFDLSGITDWQRYRWKIYTVIVQPLCLLQFGGE
jgi:prepilin-type N-terminal cleavage/methylation domain-containing protein